MSETPPVDDTRFGMHRVFMDEPEGVAETVGDVPVCPTCLRAFQASKYGPAICEDCWQEDLQRAGGGGKRFVTAHGEKKHFSARCPHLRGSTYRMVSDEACVLGRRGPCGTCGAGGRDATVLTDGGTENGAHCAECGDWYPDDGKTAGTMGGRFLCTDCCGVAVVFVGECIDCDYTYRVSGRSSNRYSVKQRVQQENNNHETKMKHFEDESHETVWREVEPTDSERENPVMPDA